MKLDNNEFIMVTKTVKTDRQAVEEKMKALSPKLFGLFNPVPYELRTKRKIYIPYEFFTYSYRISRGRNLSRKKSILDETGEVGIIFDLNEVHPFFFDLTEELKLFKKPAASIDGDIVPDHCSREEVEEKSAETVRFKYLNRALKQVNDLNLISRHKFYREAWELTVVAHGKEMIRYAYMDVYGSMNEHVSGLRVRLDV